jgi:hypothetical protein
VNYSPTFPTETPPPQEFPTKLPCKGLGQRSITPLNNPFGPLQYPFHYFAFPARFPRVFWADSVNSVLIIPAIHAQPSNANAIAFPSASELNPPTQRENANNLTQNRMD